MRQCVASISSFPICLQYIVLIICERVRGIALQYLYYKIAPILFSILISCCRCILPVEIAYSWEEVGTRRHKVGFHSEQYIWPWSSTAQSCSQTSIENRKFQIVLQDVLHERKEIRMDDHECTSVKRSAYISLNCTWAWACAQVAGWSYSVIHNKPGTIERVLVQKHTSYKMWARAEDAFTWETLSIVD